MKLVLKLLFIGLILSFTACVKDVDFNQAKELELTPTYIASLVNFDVPENLLVLTPTTEQTTITDRATFSPIGSDGKTSEYLKKIELQFKINNPFNRNFVLTFRFLDENNLETYPAIVLNVAENNTDFEDKEEILLANHPEILNSTQVEATLELIPSSDGSVLDINGDKVFTFKSAGTLYFRIN